MIQILIEHDKLKDETSINGEKLTESLYLHLLQEIEWEGQTFLVFQIEQDFRSQRARAVLKEAYIRSVNMIERDHQ